MFRMLFLFGPMAAASPALAEPPTIEAVEIANGRADVTLSHPDTGWDHYADVWRVYTPDGTMLAERVLVHPHVNEQPFTRSAGVSIPEGLRQVQIIAGCNLGDMSEPYVLELAQ